MTEEEVTSDKIWYRIWDLGKQPVTLSTFSTLIDATVSLFVNPLGFRQKKEKEMMTNNEETRQESTQTQTQIIAPPPTLTPLQQAIKDFDQIKQALAGSEPEWCLPRLDPKTKVSEPKLDQELVSGSCNVNDIE
jgi:hypothetical protein